MDTQWSDQAKARENDLTEAFRKRRDKLSEPPEVTLGQLLAAREDLAVLEKTSNASVRKNTSSSLNKVSNALVWLIARMNSVMLNNRFCKYS